MYNPKMYQYYEKTARALEEAYPTLARNFYDSVFAALTLNFHPKTVAVPHYDHANLAHGWCAITSFGNFNPDQGGTLHHWHQAPTETQHAAHGRGRGRGRGGRSRGRRW